MNSRSISRRDFLGPMAGGMALLAVHDQWAARSFATLVDEARPVARARHRAVLPRESPRITRLQLQTAVPLAKMREFYADTIGFEVIASDEKVLTLQTGKSEISFEHFEDTSTGSESSQVTEQGKPNPKHPFYHFAFNIPHNKILAARDWQRHRTPLVPTPPQLIDPQFPADVRHFANWNAHSIFFFDPAFNIVEYIARHDLPNQAEDPDAFDVRDILYASEIGFVCSSSDRDAIAARVQKDMGLHEYPLGTTPWAMGDEHGLLLILGNLGNLWGENTDTPVRWNIFPTTATINGPASPAGTFGDLPYAVHAAARDRVDQ